MTRARSFSAIRSGRLTCGLQNHLGNDAVRLGEQGRQDRLRLKLQSLGSWVIRCASTIASCACSVNC